METVQTAPARKHARLIALALVVGLLFEYAYFWQVVGSVVSTGTTDWLFRTIGWLATLVLLPYWVLSAVTSDLVGYLSISLAGLVLAFACLLWARPGRVARLLLALAVVAILAFPLLRRYAPVVTAAPGYQAFWLSEPGLIGSVVKSGQVFTEATPCTYTLLGWKEDTLYYQAACKNQSPQAWSFSPARQSTPVLTPTVPADLYKQDLSRNDVLKQLQFAHPHASGDDMGLSLHVREGLRASPDGRWVALVSKYVYGPEDVLVVSRAMTPRE